MKSIGARVSGEFKVGTRYKPVIVISQKLLARVQYLVTSWDQECQWFHQVSRRVDGDRIIYKLSDLLIPEQETFPAFVESTGDLTAKLWMQIREERNMSLAELSPIMKSTTCWCHSHVNMPARPSGTDVQQFQEQIELGLNGGQSGPQLMMIFNKKGDVYAQVVDIETNLVFENVPIEIDHRYDFSDIDEIISSRIKKGKRVSTVIATSHKRTPSKGDAKKKGSQITTMEEWQAQWEDEQLWGYQSR
jgi:hypothetical protein